MSTVIWLLVGGTTGNPGGNAAFAMGAAALIATLVVARWTLRAGARHQGQRMILLAAAVGVLGILPFVIGSWGAFFAVLALFPAAGRIPGRNGAFPRR